MLPQGSPQRHVDELLAHADPQNRQAPVVRVVSELELVLVELGDHLTEHVARLLAVPPRFDVRPSGQEQTVDARHRRVAATGRQGNRNQASLRDQVRVLERVLPRTS